MLVFLLNIFLLPEKTVVIVSLDDTSVNVWSVALLMSGSYRLRVFIYYILCIYIYIYIYIIYIYILYKTWLVLYKCLIINE